MKEGTPGASQLQARRYYAVIAISIADHGDVFPFWEIRACLTYAQDIILIRIFTNRVEFLSSMSLLGMPPDAVSKTATRPKYAL
jgi:hypothetical protein